MPETAETSTEKRSLVKELTNSLSRDGRFLYYPEMDCRVNKDESKQISQFAFFDMVHQIDDPDQNIRLAVVLQVVHSLGHATRNMILDQLKWLHRIYPQKLIPCIDADEERNIKTIGNMIKKLLDKGLLLSLDYVTEQKKRIVVYACTMYGWIFFRNKLQVQTPYDRDAVFRVDIDVLKQLTVTSVASSLSHDRRCTAVCLNGNYGSDKYSEIKVFTYGVVEFDGGGEDGFILILEPVFYRFNPKTTTKDENEEKIRNRLTKIENAIPQAVEKYNTHIKICYIVENINGISNLLKLAEMNLDSPLFENAIYTSDNIVCDCGGELNREFLKFVPADDGGGVKLVPAKNTWSRFI